MDELGDYLYLIFIGLAIVSTLFGKKKRKMRKNLLKIQRRRLIGKKFCKR